MTPSSSFPLFLLLPSLPGVILNFRPFGNPTIDNFAIGGDILMVAGNVILNAVNHQNHNTFQQSYVMGARITVLGELKTPRKLYLLRQQQ